MMDDFFKGWKRKVGVVTLVMACVFMGGWVRSLNTLDVFNWRADDKLICFAISNQGLLSWQRLQESHPRQLTLSNFYSTGNATALDPLENAQEVKWHWKSCGFESGEIILRITGWRKAFSVVPYWSIVSPLTLISLWLLLSKPRKSSPTKIAEPTFEQVA